jgi:hypothetical protein
MATVCQGFSQETLLRQSGGINLDMDVSCLYAKDPVISALSSRRFIGKRPLKWLQSAAQRVIVAPACSRRIDFQIATSLIRGRCAQQTLC